MRKKPIKHLTLKLHWAKRLTWFFYLATLGSFSASFLIKHDRSQITSWAVLAVYLLPLLAFLPGLIFGHPRNQVILCFFILLYFCFAVMNSFAPGLFGQISVAEAIAEGGLFATAMYYARWQGRTNWLAEQATNPSLL